MFGDGICAPGVSSGDYFLYSSDFDSLELNLGWRYDSRNRAIFADRGARHRFNIGYTVPGSDVEYWTASYDYLQFVPIWRSLTLMFNVELAYGEALGDTTALPPYRQYFGGGPDSVRGFRESRLGPKDNFGRPYGGNIKTIAQTELLLPMPEKWRNSARFSLFYDIGNVFSNQNVRFFGPQVDANTQPIPVEYHFSYDELRSVGRRRRAMARAAGRVPVQLRGPAQEIQRRHRRTLRRRDRGFPVLDRSGVLGGAALRRFDPTTMGHIPRLDTWHV